MIENLYAEEVGHFWHTSKTPAETWIERTIKLIKDHGGKPLQSLIGADMETGRSAFLLVFQFDQETYKISWPVLKTKTKDEKGAKIQAATLLHHVVKTKLMEAMVLGTRVAFFSFLMLPDGRTASEINAPDIAELFLPKDVKQLPTGETVDGIYKEI
jgi:hypothetical protein